MLTNEEDYVSSETAKLLNEKGFKGYSIITIYDEDAANAYVKELLEKHLPYSSDDPKLKEFHYTQPTLQMAMKWLRKKHLLHISIDMVNGGRWEYEIDDISSPFDGGVIPKYYCDKSFSSYEEAADDAIRYSLEHLIK